MGDQKSLNMYAFTYLNAEKEIKNTGAVWADSLPHAAVTIALRFPTVIIMGMSYVPECAHNQILARVADHGAIRTRQPDAAMFEWGRGAQLLASKGGGFELPVEGADGG